MENDKQAPGGAKPCCGAEAARWASRLVLARDRRVVGLDRIHVLDRRVGAVGDDEAGSALTKALANHPLIEFHLVIDGGRQTTRKVRFVSEHHSTHLLRADWETAVAVDAGSEDALIGHMIKAIPRVGAVVLSDYAKGALTPRVVGAVIDAANERGKPVVVDPKGRDYSIYYGATLITPNRQELADVTGGAVTFSIEPSGPLDHIVFLRSSLEKVERKLVS